MTSGALLRDREESARPAVAVIPVIDLMDGVVVRARAGERAGYRPIETPLAPSAEPVGVAAGLVDATGATRLYIADLDSIEGRGGNGLAVQAIAAAHPDVEIWLDAGFADERSLAAFIESGLGRPVLGSESQSDTTLLSRYRADLVLSLDFRGDTPLGPAEVHNEPWLWPDEIIVMTLARVGAGAGPDLARLAAIQACAPAARLYAAGGLRGPEDLSLLRQAGAAGVLVASAIHDGSLRREHLV